MLDNMALECANIISKIAYVPPIQYNFVMEEFDMYLISVFFDEKSNQPLEKYINRIAEVTENSFMTDNNVPPHLTISAIEAKSEDVLLPAFLSLKNQLKQGDIQIATIGQMLPYVMYGSVVMNQYLLELSTKIYDIYKSIPETTISRYYRPLSWLPHITLGKTLDKEQMKKAFEVMQESFVPMTATVSQISLAKANPHRNIELFDLL